MPEPSKCARCGLCWNINDPEPPKCDTKADRSPVEALSTLWAARLFGRCKRKVHNGPWHATLKTWRGKVYALHVRRLPPGGWHPDYTSERL